MPKRKSYTVQEKLESITRVTQHGETQANVSRDNGISESTLCGLIRDEHKMLDFVNIGDSNDGTKRKKARTAGDTDLNRAVYSWFVKEKQAGTAISDQFKIIGEVRSADFKAAVAFMPILQTYILDNDLVPEQIYNADETVLY